MTDSLSILTVMLEDEYGDPSQGPSSEYQNFALPLQKHFPGTHNFDYMKRARAVGNEQMNQELIDLVARERPDVTLVLLYSNFLKAATIRAISPYTIRVAYFFDDIWQRRYSVSWAREFDIVTTPDPMGVKRFERDGIRHAIYSPFFFNEDVFRRLDLPRTIDVSFVGQFHPHRAWLISRLRRAGFDARAHGNRWPAARVSFAQMTDLFNSSKINLNLSNRSHWNLPFLISDPLAVPRMLKLGKHEEQVKQRHFEIPGCAGFQLSYDVAWLGDYFIRGREIAVFDGADDLVRQVEYFLSHEDERESIAEAGWRRAHAEHTAAIRLTTLVRDVLSHRRARA